MTPGPEKNLRSPLVPPLGLWPARCSELEPPPGWSWLHPPPMWMAKLTERGSAGERAAILHDLGWAALLAGQETKAAAQFEEGLALTRNWQAARSQHTRLLIGLSNAERMLGLYDQALRRARAALGNGDPQEEFRARLAEATALRLSGQIEHSDRSYHLARLLAPPAHQDDLQALLDLVVPGRGRPDHHLLSPDLRARVFMQDAERLLEHGLKTTRPRRTLPLFSLRDEGRVLPRVLLALGVTLPAPPQLAVRVVTRGRIGLQLPGRFVPLPGQGHTLALLAYLVEFGSSPWLQVAEAVIETDPARSSEHQVYGQVKYHVSRLRTLLGDKEAVTLRRHRLGLDRNWSWSTDLREDGPPIDLQGPTGWINDLS